MHLNLISWSPKDELCLAGNVGQSSLCDVECRYNSDFYILLRSLGSCCSVVGRAGELMLINTATCIFKYTPNFTCKQFSA